MSYIVHAPGGSYCLVCQSILSQEEIDFEVCDACGGEGLGDDDDFDPVNLQGSGPAPIMPREG
jgi:hypothetical protein